MFDDNCLQLVNNIYMEFVSEDFDSDLALFNEVVSKDCVLQVVWYSKEGTHWKLSFVFFEYRQVCVKWIYLLCTWLKHVLVHVVEEI